MKRNAGHATRSTLNPFLRPKLFVFLARNDQAAGAA
jgi:hypothetical protein